jgi:hypothetical protein
MNDDSIVISDRWRTPIIASRQDGGGIVLRSPGRHAMTILSADELQRLFDFAHTPQLGRVERFPMALKDAPAATQSHDRPPLLSACPGLPVSGSTNATGA